MPIKAHGEDTKSQGMKLLWRNISEDEKVYLVVRAVPRAMRDRFVRDAERRYKTRKFANQTLDKATEQYEEIRNRCAAYALLDSEGFDLLSDSPSICGEVSEALGEKVEPGKVVKLDGRWTEELKAVVFRHVEIARWIDDAARKIEGVEDEEEAELGKT